VTDKPNRPTTSIHVKAGTTILVPDFDGMSAFEKTFEKATTLVWAGPSVKPDHWALYLGLDPEPFQVPKSLKHGDFRTPDIEVTVGGVEVGEGDFGVKFPAGRIFYFEWRGVWWLKSMKSTRAEEEVAG